MTSHSESFSQPMSWLPDILQFVNRGKLSGMPPFSNIRWRINEID
jgi:hypothetical protein